MNQRKSSEISAKTRDASARRLAGTQPGASSAATVVPDIRRRFYLRPGGRVLIGLAIIVLAGAVVCWQRYDPALVGAHHPAAPASAPAGDWSQTPVTQEEQVCAEFIRLKNAGNPAALALLGPAPAVPDAAVTRAEADRLQTECFLRQDVHITGVGRNKQTGALVLYARGNVSAPTLRVQAAGGAESVQRTMANPDLTVEVHDGRIRGVSSDLHHGP